jgi:hypothetical protein
MSFLRGVLFSDAASHGIAGSSHSGLFVLSLLAKCRQQNSPARLSEEVGHWPCHPVEIEAQLEQSTTAVTAKTPRSSSTPK